MKATSDMTFGVNLQVNQEMKSVGLKHNLGSSKVVLPHKTETKPKPPLPIVKTEIPKSDVTTRHDINLTVLTVIMSVLAWYLFD